MHINAFHRNVERMDSHGGWVAHATDLIKFWTGVRGNILDQDTWDRMLKRETAPSNAFKKGWWVFNPIGRGTEICGAGSMPGTASLLMIEGDNAVAIIVNGQHDGRFELAREIIDLRTAWPAWSVSSNYVNDGDWQVAHAGNGGITWQKIGHCGRLLNKLRFADFNGDAKADVFRRDDDGS